MAKREREQKQDTLWRILAHDLHGILEVDKHFEEMSRSYARDEISPRIFLTNLTPVEYARRLTELDHTHAYVYSAYEIEAEGARKRDESLDKLREQFLKEQDKNNRDKLAQAIEKEAERARKDTIKLLERELDVLKRIREARGKDKQPVVEYENAVKELKKTVPL